MSFLKSIFESVGLPVATARNHVRIAEPTKEQQDSLRAQGIDVSAGKRMFSCSPRTFSRGF